MTADLPSSPSGEPLPEARPTTRRNRRRLVVVLVALLLAAGGGIAYYVDHFLPYKHWRTVDKGAFYRSSQLNPEELGEAIDDFGLKTIFNLRGVDERTRGDWYEKQLAIAAAKGARVVDIPLLAGTAPNPEQVALMLEVLDDPKNLPAMAHCYHGSIRSAAAEGLYRREYMNESGAEANEKVESWGHDLSVKYPEIYAFIRDYVPRRDRPKKP